MNKKVVFCCCCIDSLSGWLWLYCSSPEVIQATSYKLVSLTFYPWEGDGTNNPGNHL